jgi:hypothetical protein
VKPNPPIPGHELLHEGRVRILGLRESDGRLRYVGGCRCGATPPDWPSVSAGAVRRWHRQHKADLRAAGGSS